MNKEISNKNTINIFYLNINLILRINMIYLEVLFKKYYKLNIIYLLKCYRKLMGIGDWGSPIPNPQFLFYLKRHKLKYIYIFFNYI